MTTWSKLAKRMLPDESEEVLDYLLWNHTSFPLDGPVKIARQLKEWGKLKAQELSQCIWCGKGYIAESGLIVLGGECRECEPHVDHGGHA